MARRIKTKHTEAEIAAISDGMRRAHARGAYEHARVGVLACQHCAKEIKAYKGKRFCSSACAARGTAKQRSEKTRSMTDTERRLKAVLKRRIVYHRGKVSMSQLLLWLGCSLREAVAMVESKWTNGMSWENYGKWQIDHIKACADFDLENEVHASECFSIRNLQPLWRGDNWEKEKRRRWKK